MIEIKVEGLKKVYTYGMAEPVDAIRGLSFTIGKGESVAIMGPSGAGKSTLLQILGTLDRPSQGKVYYDGLDVYSLPPLELAAFRNSKFGFVFQFHHLLPEFSALENVMMPALISGKSFKEARTVAHAILDRVGLASRLDHRPGELSGGEQQRVAVARASVLQPAVIFADEPTGNLDLATGDKVFDLLLNLNRENGITLMVVTHSQELAKRMGKVIKLADGRMVDGLTV